MIQTDRILQYIRDFGSITPKDAYNKLGCMRLASRISELKKSGIEIKKVMEKGENIYGEPVWYARYSIE